MLNCNSSCSHYHFSTRKSEVASPFHRSHARKREVPRNPRNDGSNDKRYAEGSATSSLYAVHAPRGNHLKRTVWWCTKRKGATQQYRIRWEWYASEENAIPGKTEDQRGWFEMSFSVANMLYFFLLISAFASCSAQICKNEVPKYCINIWVLRCAD